ncbi:MAG: MmcQ/YjbR family DNA-binding protein [Pseudonocardia sp.]|nr:MmcQ/YjbR family DNA-binding protein [Pseudonocardia sp.]
MTPEEIAAYSLAKPGAVEDRPWEGDLVAKVGGKIFVFLGGEGIGVKCGRTADEAAELRDRFPGAVTMSAYIGRYGWNVVSLDGTVPDDELIELVDESYDAVVSRLPRSKRPV